MASPFEDAIQMFNLPRYGVRQNSMFDRPESPQERAHRAFLEGGTLNEPDPIDEAVAASDDPYGLMQAIEEERQQREVESLIPELMKITGSPDYPSRAGELMSRYPRAAATPEVMRIAGWQDNFMPRRSTSGYDQDTTLRTKLAEALVPESEAVMTEGVYDPIKVARAVAQAKADKEAALTKEKLAKEAKDEEEKVTNRAFQDVGSLSKSVREDLDSAIEGIEGAEDSALKEFQKYKKASPDDPSLADFNTFLREYKKVGSVDEFKRVRAKKAYEKARMLGLSERAAKIAMGPYVDLVDMPKEAPKSHDPIKAQPDITVKPSRVSPAAQLKKAVGGTAGVDKP